MLKMPAMPPVEMHLHKGKLGKCLLLIAGLLLLTSTFLIPITDARPVDDFSKQVEKIRAVSQWRIIFTYARNYTSDFDGGNIGGSDFERINSSGAASFGKEMPEDEDEYYDEYDDEEENDYYEEEEADDEEDYEDDSILTLYANGGAAEYDLEIYHAAKLNDYYIVDSESGEGFADIGAGSILEFEFEDHSYSFMILPGGGEGVPSKSYRLSNITETLIKEMDEAGRPVMFPEKLKAMFPDKMRWNDFSSSYAVSVSRMPIPASGLTLKGKMVSLDGDTITWTIEPVDSSPPSQ